MAKQTVLAGDTSRIEYVFIPDSSVTTGAGKTGLLFNTSSLVAYYIREGAAATVISLVTQTTTGAYSSGGFVEMDATNMPGIYRVDIPNAVFAAGVKKAVVMIKGAANAAPVALEYQLVAYNPNDAVRLGLTALPNATAGASGGVPLGDASGRVDIGKLLGTAWLTPGTAGTPDVNVKLWNALATVALPLVPATAGRSLVVDAAGLADANMVKMGPTGTGTAQTARDIGANVLLSPGTGTGQISLTAGAVLLQATQTGVTIPTVTSLTNAPTAGDFTATMKASIGTAVAASAVASVTGNVGGSVASVVGAVGSVTGAVGSIGTGGITTTSFAAGAINAAAIAAGAITNLKFAAGAIDATAIGATVFSADIKKMNGVTLNGNGGVTPWGP